MIVDKKIYYKDDALEVSRTHYEKHHSNMPMHCHDYLTISLLLTGTLIEQVSDNSHTGQAGYLTIKPANLFHSDFFTEDCSFLSLKIYDWEYYGFDFRDWLWLSESLTLKHFLDIVRSKNMKKSLDQFKSFLTDRIVLSKKEYAPVWLLNAHQLIIENLQENLNISDIAKKVGRHPVHLSRTFMQFYGMDLKAYHRHLYFHYGISNSLNVPKKLTEIAYNGGFSDQSHFCRTFKKIMSMTPGNALALLDV